MVAKKKGAADEGEEEQGEWSPDQPLEDSEAEEQAAGRAQAHARYEYLKGQHLSRLKGEEKKKKKSGGYFDRD